MIRLSAAAVAVATVFLLGACAGTVGAPGPVPPGATALPSASQTYVLIVANESSDVISRVRFRPGAPEEERLEVVSEVPVGIMPADTDAPHGVETSPDGRFWYVTIAHGQPFGTLWKFDAAKDTLIGRVELGLFPASMGVSPSGDYLYVVNFNLHGDPVPSTVSVVHTPTMTEIARPVTCVMPHGVKVDRTGARAYSACMHSDQLVQIDTRTFQVSARFSLAPGRPGPLALEDRGEHAHHHMGGSPVGRTCSPTWATPGVGVSNGFVYVPCNRADEVLEVDVGSWEVTRRFPTGRAPYNLAVSPDGRRLLATLKGDQSLAVFDLESGTELARPATSQPITHGVVVSPDGRYAFVTNEAIGGTPGTMDVLDMATLRMVGSVALRFQPGGIAHLPGAVE